MADGRPVHVIVIRGQGSASDFRTLDVASLLTLRLGQAGKALTHARRHGIRDLVMVGAVRRPNLATLWPDPYTARVVARIGARALGDDSLLSAVIAQMEAEGFTVHPVDSLLGDVLGARGALGCVGPDRSAWMDIRRGWDVAAALGRADVGQSVVVQQGVALGVEAVEGTDALIARCGSLHRPGPGGVLVKRCKPGQDRRADLPTIGPDTVDAVRAAGLRGIAYEAGASLVVGAARVRDKADRAGVFVIGVTEADVDAASAVAAGLSDLPATGMPGGGPLVYLIAGEPSGDALGARLMEALRGALGAGVVFDGIGGEAMAEQGLASRVPQRELAIMGFLEVLPRVRRLRRRLRETVDHILAVRPDVVVTIDSWGFTGRVAKALKAAGSPVPRVHYVAPMVWAWKEKRKYAVADRVNHLLTLWPFECAYFQPLGLPCTHVGHAVIESGVMEGDGTRLRRDLAIPDDAPILAVLPGSRSTEVGRLLPVFAEVVRTLARRRPGLHVVVPTVATVADTVAAAVQGWALPAHVVQGTGPRHDAFAAATAALAASGTVSLELAVAGVPHLIAYRVNPISAALFRRMTSLRYAGPVNLLMDRLVVPEFLQTACRADRLAEALAPLLDGGPEATAQREAFTQAVDRLTAGRERSPSEVAADTIAKIIAAGRQD